MNDYIRDLIQKGKREDGRGLMDLRRIKITPNVIQNAEGSAMVEYRYTKVLAGVKLGVGSPMPDKPKEGNMMTMAELLPMASPHFEMGPPSPEAVELSRVIDRGIRAAGMIDMGSLFIEDEKVWEVFIDMYVLNYNGNLFDAGTLAAVSALANCRMPKYEDKAVIREGNLGKLKIGNIVTSCTFGKLYGKIVLDPDGNEEEFMDGRITIANDEKVVRAMQKGLYGTFTPNEVEQLIDTTFERSKELRDLVNKSKGE